MAEPSAVSPARVDELPKLEQYELFEEIGHGGMATVYRAKDPRLGREVAVKIIHRHLRDNAEVAARFVAEARAAAKLKHPGIVEVYDVSREEDREKYLVAELIRGCTLRKVLTMHREMPAEIGAAIVVELCDAVEQAHEAGIIHRDIKPENVLVELPEDRARAHRGDAMTPVVGEPTPVPARSGGDDIVDEQASSAPREVEKFVSDEASPTTDRPSGRATKQPKSGRNHEKVVIKLTDFGIAKVLDGHSMTSTGQVLGSPAHMAPEQIEGGEIDGRTDVFALGVLLYECMVGHLPFEGKNPAQVLRRVIEGEFAPADTERPIVGGRFGEIVARSLATSPADRTASPSALAEDLRKELEALGLSALSDEITAYFADPDGYREALAKRVVPKLIARGETLRRERKIPLAAADFNRAHAIAPNDPTILKRITALASARGRKRLAKRVALLGVGALSLGSLAYGAVRFSRGETPHLGPDPAPTFASDETQPILHIVPDSIDRTAEPTTAFPSAHPSARVIAVVRAAGSADTSSGPPAAPRTVRFAVTPMGAKLEVDSMPMGFGQTVDLSSGSHSYSLAPPQGETCCDRVASTFDVTPPPKDKPSEPQTVQLSLKMRPATVSLEGAPADGQVVCTAFGNLSVGASRTINLRSPEWTGPCDFLAAGAKKTQTVTLRSGAANPIAWPR